MSTLPKDLLCQLQRKANILRALVGGEVFRSIEMPTQELSGDSGLGVGHGQILLRGSELQRSRFRVFHKPFSPELFHSSWV